MSVLTSDFLMHKLKRVIDPEVDMNIVDMGLVYNLGINNGIVDIEMTLTTQGCPMEGFITANVREVLGTVEGVQAVNIDLVWEPRWTPEKMNPLAMRARQMPLKDITLLDVRPILKAGGEPFGAIMEAIGRTADDGGLKLFSSFKPAPLFSMLGSKGWRHWIESGEGDEWVIWFFKSNDVSEQKTTKAEEVAAHLQKEKPELRDRLQTVGDKWYLDVRHMAPPEPMELTLEVLEKLPEQVNLIQINERTPQFLFETLADRGFKYEVQDLNGEIRTTIRR